MTQEKQNKKYKSLVATWTEHEIDSGKRAKDTVEYEKMLFNFLTEDITGKNNEG